MVKRCVSGGLAIVLEDRLELGVCDKLAWTAWMAVWHGLGSEYVAGDGCADPM